MRLRAERTETGHQLAGDGVDVELVNRFLEHLSVRNFATATRRAYAYDLLAFGRFCAERGLSLAVLTPTEVFDCLDWQQTAWVRSPDADRTRMVVALRDYRGAAPARRPGGSAQAYSAAPPVAQPRSRRSGLPAATLCPLLRRLAAGVRRSQTRGRTDQSRIAAFLREELKLELSQSKTLITHATSQAAHFLRYEIRAQHSDTKISRNRRAVNGAIERFVPKTVIRQRCALYMSNGKPAQRGALLHDDDFTSSRSAVSSTPGWSSPNLLAQDVFRLGRLRWIMETSMLKTLAGKHRSTVTRWLDATKRRSSHPRDRAQSFRSASNATEEGNH
jgi:hypothetical protein